MAATTTGTDSSTTPNGSSNGKTKALTAIEAITKITKILDQLTEPDRKRVLTFVNESNT